ncbi:hypothetical protein C162_32356 [Paenibacillus sp. FSL R7-269]|uniref:restriction endonuclease n=1 Tax=Paenibacillus sp. FSL R7-269 TaxID=1226755 RepID=UPI0003E25CF7|nr:restriction endonuclease [Paenibacillus sp. FSL R7-269]ETT31687.1 hypothetical protein C162_32356 [Paenibacillus sp. FSL R7-269]
MEQHKLDEENIEITMARVKREERLQRHQDEIRKKRAHADRLWREHIQRSNIDYIDKMNGIEFENILKYFFENIGYRVRTTTVSGDQGVDLIIEKENKRIGLQAKRYSEKNRVGNKAVQEIISGVVFYDLNEGWVITTSTFTDAAVQLAEKAKIQLIDRYKLKTLLAKQQKKQFEHWEVITCYECGVLNRVDFIKVKIAKCGKCGMGIDI